MQRIRFSQQKKSILYEVINFYKNVLLTIRALILKNLKTGIKLPKETSLKSVYSTTSRSKESTLILICRRRLRTGFSNS